MNFMQYHFCCTDYFATKKVMYNIYLTSDLNALRNVKIFEGL